MKRNRYFLLSSALVVLMLSSLMSNAQCPVSVLASGLKSPGKVILAQGDSLLVTEAGPAPNTGRISIINLRNGNRRTLLDGLPSGLAPPNNDAAGPSALFLRGNTLFVAISVGDSVINGAVPATQVPNPNPSSPIFSSVLALRFHDRGRLPDDGATLTLADQVTLKNGGQVTLGHGDDRFTVKMVGDFPDYTHEPRPGEPNNVRQSNPFGLVVIDDFLFWSSAQTCLCLARRDGFAILLLQLRRRASSPIA